MDAVHVLLGPSLSLYLRNRRLVAALGSTCGLALLAACASAPASLVYTLSGITGIVTAALVSVLFLEEQAGIGWYVTIGLGVLSIVLGAIAR